MPDTRVSGETSVRSATAGIISEDPLHGWARSPEVVRAMIQSASDLMTFSEELPVLDLEETISGETLAIIGVYRSLSGPSASGEATGTLTETYTTGRRLRSGQNPDSESDQLSPSPGFGSAQTSGISRQPLIAFVLGLTAPQIIGQSTVDGSTQGTLVQAAADSYLRRSYRHGLSEPRTTADSPQMETESDYPNLLRALNSGVLGRLSRPPAPTPRPVEEPIDVDVERQIRYGRTADPPTYGLQRRPGVRNSLFDD